MNISSIAWGRSKEEVIAIEGSQCTSFTSSILEKNQLVLNLSMRLWERDAIENR